ncbi:MAG: ABC transporter permease [Micrococcales bacterium]|nr:MAG: ABC transporter permease [Micrococcales bacterium]
MTYPMHDSWVMLRRVLRHTRRNPSVLIMAIVLPLLILLLLNYGFGGALAATFPAGAKYINYLPPGIILMAAAYSGGSTATAVNTDVSEGIFDRFRAMPITRSALLNGHVIGSTIRTLIGIVLVVLVSLALGFGPNATPLEWLAALGLILLMLYAIAWWSVAFGLVARNAASAAGLGALITLLPFLSSAFVPIGTMPHWLRVFTANQPMTPTGDTLRGLLIGEPIGNSGWIAAAWWIGLAVVGFLWSRSAFERRSV